MINCCFKAVKVWFRFPLETSFQEQYGTTDTLEDFRDVFLQMGGVCRETCSVRSSGKAISRKGWSLKLESLPLHIAKLACEVVSLLSIVVVCVLFTYKTMQKHCFCTNFCTFKEHL